MDNTVSNCLRILVVDDERIILDLFDAVLSSSVFLSGDEAATQYQPEQPKVLRDFLGGQDVSFDMTLVEEGLEAIENVEASIKDNRPYAVAFIDYNLQTEISGVDVAEKIRQLDPYVNIIIFTGYSDIDPRDILPRVPPADKLLYLKKPLAAKEIFQLVTTLWSKWNVERQLRTICLELEERVAKQTAELVKINKDLVTANLALIEKTIQDELTSLFNKRHFNDRLDEAITYSWRYEAPLSLLMIDIDYFKKYNDTHGHLEGDRLLARIGDLLNDSVRQKIDIPCRYGGEEFSIILPNTTLDGAVILAERIRAQVDDKTDISVSIGVAELNSEKHQSDDLVRQADKKLYQAKADGRNQVCS